MTDATYGNAMMSIFSWGWRREPGSVVAQEMPSLLPGALEALEHADITTRDIARGPAPLSVSSKLSRLARPTLNRNLSSTPIATSWE